MKHSYEMTVIFRNLQSEEETQQAIDQVTAWIETSKEFEDPGAVTRIDRNLLGRRRLRYEIKGQRDGYYILFYTDILPDHLPELELNLKLYDPVLRYLIILDETPAPAAEAESNE